MLDRALRPMCGPDEADFHTGVRPFTSATEATITWTDQTLVVMTTLTK